MRMRNIILLVVLILLSHVPRVWTLRISIGSKGLFHEFFPLWREYLIDARDKNCSEPYHVYLTESPPPAHPEALAAEMVRCMLASDFVDEGMKANMASAAVILGLLPTILSLVGASTAEVSLLALRRPVFALFLASGSQAVSPIRNHEYHEPVEKMEPEEGEWDVSEVRLPGKWTAVLEWLIAMGAVANVLYVGLELSTATVSSFASSKNYLIWIWMSLTPVVYLFGMIGLACRVKIHNKVQQTRLWAVQRVVYSWLRRELQPCANHDPSVVTWGEENKAFFAFTWFTAVGSVCHVFFGTLVLSSAMFISVEDSLPIAARYLASSFICRAVMGYELRGLRCSMRAVTKKRRQLSFRLDEYSSATLVPGFRESETI
jgi:hypothetical protein